MTFLLLLVFWFSLKPLFKLVINHSEMISNLLGRVKPKELECRAEVAIWIFELLEEEEEEEGLDFNALMKSSDVRIELLIRISSNCDIDVVISTIF